MVKLDVEYCPRCNFEPHCRLLSAFVLEQLPDTEVTCRPGRQGSFEVKIDDTQVHSKLQSLAFPDHQSVLENVRRANDGLPVTQVKAEPINSCIIL